MDVRWMDSPRTNLHSERFESKYYSKDSQFGRAFAKNPLVLAVLRAIPSGWWSSLAPKLVNFRFPAIFRRFRALLSQKVNPRSRIHLRSTSHEPSALQHLTEPNVRRCRESDERQDGSFAGELAPTLGNVSAQWFAVVLDA